MKDKLNEIYDNTIPHSAFLSKGAIDSCMMQAYLMGLREHEEKYDKLKKAFEQLLEEWGDFGNYNSSRNHMEEDWKKLGGLL
jgi:hypothetical protein